MKWVLNRKFNLLTFLRASSFSVNILKSWRKIGFFAFCRLISFSRASTTCSEVSKTHFSLQNWIKAFKIRYVKAKPFFIFYSTSNDQKSGFASKRMQLAAKGLKYYWKLLLSLSDILSSLWTNWDWRLKAESFLFQTELFLRSQTELFLRSSMLPRGRFTLKIFLLTLGCRMGLWNILRVLEHYEFVKIAKSVIYVLRFNSDEKYFKKPRNGHFEILRLHNLKFQITIAWELFK